jgi:hypothetical protein
MNRSAVIRNVMIASLTISSARANGDVTLYSQSPNFAYGGATSIEQLPITADDFTPTGIWQLSSATVQGAWRDADEPIPPGATTRDFRIQFYADNAGLPSDAPFQDFSVVATIGNPQNNPDGFTIYDVSITFPSSLTFAPGTNYWFAVLDEGSGRSGSAGFFWSNSADGDGDLAQNANSGWQLFNGNLGFLLIGTTVPEPGTTLLAIISVALGSVRSVSRFRRKSLP